jgi:RecA DNA recombination protein
MSSLSWNVVDPPPLPSGVRDFHEKREAILKHVAGSERLMEVRPASRLEVRPRPETLVTGIAALDSLSGGLPRGCLTEICGAASSGKTTVLVAALAAATQQGETCVLIDASDSFDPGSGAKAGVEFGKLLWVRCGTSLCASVPSGAENRTFHHREHRDAQKATTSEHRLEQVLKATDLVLQSGGFGLVALDLAGIPQKFVRRIPLASWFRFQRAIEHTKTALLVVSEFACAQTCAALALKLTAIHHQSSGQPAHAQILEGLHMEAELLRSRLERKPMQSVRAVFKSQAISAG